jgi:two-component system nitrogen regulation response regulator NtrX
MPVADESIETILIVDDEESVRRTFREWLESSGQPCHIITANDAETALREANRQPIDLAILDWNLGAGHDGLRLLEDLYVFQPKLVAILITGFAHQATPLDAMRMGVRDYLDKNQDLDRETFLATVGRQLEFVRPAKRERRLHASLAAFREAVEKALPLVQAAAALNDPVPLPEAVHGLLRFLLDTTGARDAVLLVHRYDPQSQPSETYRAYDARGQTLADELVPFARSLASAVVSLGRPSVLDLRTPAGGAVDWQPFEREHQNVLAVPMAVAPDIQVVLELFDKPTFTEEDERLAVAGAALGTELLRHGLAQKQSYQMLFAAVEAALHASADVSQTLDFPHQGDHPPPDLVMERLRAGLGTQSGAALSADDTVRLAEKIRVLALRHGPAAVQHCVRLVEQLLDLLDTVTGAGDPRP